MRPTGSIKWGPRALALGLVACVIVQATPASAQTPKIEFTIAAVVDGASSAGVTHAELVDPSGNPFTLFEAKHRTTWAPGLEGRVDWRVTDRWAVGVTGSWSRPDFETRISGDAEGADPVTAALGMDRFAVELGVERRFGTSTKWQPFARVGAGWLRELADDRALADSGVAAHVGGGLKYWVREGRPGWLGHIALRAEARLTLRRGGITLGDAGNRWAPTVAAGMVIAR